MLNLDTHILIYALAGGLRARERHLLSVNRWSISPIVLWELAKLSQMGRISLDIDSPELAQALSKIHIWSLDLGVCRRVKALDFPGDPADGIIAATSVFYNVPLLTRDRAIRRSNLVPFA